MDWGTNSGRDVAGFSVMDHQGAAPDPALRWYALTPPPEAMLRPRREARPFGLDDQPGPEDLA